MNTVRPKKYLVFLLAAVIVMSMAVVSHVVDDERDVYAATVSYNLTIGPTTVTMPDGTAVLMWGIGLDADPITVPGPTLEAVEGDDLVLNLTNNLPEPVTIVIPGQTIEDPTPVMDGGRARSFTPENASVTFPNLKAGTYLYECGTHPSKNVQMGIYGVLIVRPLTPGQAYDDDISAYDTEHVVILSDIDPALHDAVEAGTYGTAAYPSTVDMRPKYFLLNGNAFPATDDLVANNGDTVLIRFVNAGMQTYVPTLNYLPMMCIALDGNLLPFPQRVNSLILPAGQTKDVIVTPGDNTASALYDSRGSLSNAGARRVGGMLTHLLTGTAQTPILSAVPDVGTFRAGTWLFDDNGSREFENVDEVIAFGLATDTPLIGDWNGDSIDDIGVFRNGGWFLDASGSGVWDAGDKLSAFGLGTDTPIVGDWNGDGTDEIGVVRNGVWYLDANNNGSWDGGDIAFAFGLATDTPIVGDWNGDGTDDIGVFRADGSWSLDLNGNGLWDGGDAYFFYGGGRGLPLVANR
jgi:FtsP/CotA-like multicopper oxidase with cupredoxin domain